MKPYLNSRRHMLEWVKEGGGKREEDGYSEGVGELVGSTNPVNSTADTTLASSNIASMSLSKSLSGAGGSGGGVKGFLWRKSVMRRC